MTTRSTALCSSEKDRGLFYREPFDTRKKRYEL